jgi:hypothetical protein
MSELTRLLLEHLPPESGPWLLAAADWWELVSQVALLLAVAVLLGCLGFVVGFVGGER